MKQKNVFLIALAAGCGLAAAFAVKNLSAAPKRVVEETIPVLVAAKDLPVGTRLKKEDLDAYLEVKEFTKETAPQQYIAVKEELADKRTTRTLRKGDSFNPADVTKFASLSPPQGFNMMTVDCTLEKGVAGFAPPGSRVDVIAAIPVKDRRLKEKAGGDSVSYVVPLFIDMLVLAVDTSASLSNENQNIQTMAMVSFAVTPDQSLLLHAAKHRGSDIRLVLRNPDKPNLYEKVYTNKELWSILAEVPNFDDKDENPDQQDKDKVSLPVAKEDVPAGTKLTNDVITAKFEMKAFSKPVPPAAIENLREFAGQYLTSKLSAGQFVPKSFVGEKEDKPKPAAPDAATPKPGPVGPKGQPEKSVAPPVYHDYTHQTPNGVKKFRYQVLPNGQFKYLGEVPHDGAPDAAPADEDDDAPAPKKQKPAPKAAPDGPPAPGKGEKSGEPVLAPAA